MKTVALFLGALLLTPALRAGDAGRSAVGALRLEETVRQSSLGGSGVADIREPGAAQLNPAALGHLASKELRASYHRLFEDVGLGSLAYARPMGRWGWSARLDHLDYGAFAGRDAQGAAGGDATASHSLLAVSAAAAGETLSSGATVKIIRESLAGQSALAPALDLGVVFRLSPDRLPDGFLAGHLRRLRFGAAVKNVGPQINIDGTGEKLPRAWTAGLSHQSFGEALNLSIDAERYAGRRETILHAGAELWVKGDFALRGGYRSDGDAGPGFAGGLGFLWNRARIDYSFRPFSALGDVHRFGVTLAFGESAVERAYQDGLRELRRGNPAEAVLHFNKALALDPKNKKILRKALEAADALDKSLGAGDNDADAP